MRIRFLPALIAIALLWGGGQNLYTGLRNREVTRLPCASLLSAAPRAEWIRLEGCALDVGNTAVNQAGTEVFIPLVPPGAPKGSLVRVVLASREQATLALASAPSPSGAALPLRDVEGVVQFGIELKESRRKAIVGIVEHVAPDFVLLEEGQRPKTLLGGGMFLGGLLLLAFLIRRLRSP